MGRGSYIRAPGNGGRGELGDGAVSSPSDLTAGNMKEFV